MKIAISSTGTEIDSEIDQRFGRCNYFLIFDDETNNLEVFQTHPHLPQVDLA